MSKAVSTIGSVGIAAVAMYFLDPQQGRTRRAAMRDQIQKASIQTRKAADVGSRDLAKRTAGVLASIRSLLPSQRQPVADEQLAARVRSKIGHVLSHPKAIATQVSGNTVTLKGPILRAEVPLLMARVWAIPGVQEVVNQLDIHDRPGSVPALQGEGRSAQQLLLQRTRTPGARMATGVAGLGMGLWGMTSSSTLGKWSLISLGAGLLAYALGSDPRRSDEESGLLRPSDLVGATDLDGASDKQLSQAVESAQRPQGQFTTEEDLQLQPASQPSQAALLTGTSAGHSAPM